MKDWRRGQQTASNLRLRMKTFSMKHVIIGLLCLGLTGCVGTPTKPPSPVLPSVSNQTPAVVSPPVLSPIQAIMAVAEHPEGVTGVFEMEVRGTGRTDGWLYLNSEADYRDQRCLTIALSPEAAWNLEMSPQFNGPEHESVVGAPVMVDGDMKFEARVNPLAFSGPMAALKGRTIRVNGTAERVTIRFTAGGQKTDRYYYQTQVRLTDASALSVVR